MISFLFLRFICHVIFIFILLNLQIKFSNKLNNQESTRFCACGYIFLEFSHKSCQIQREFLFVDDDANNFLLKKSIIFRWGVFFPISDVNLRLTVHNVFLFAMVPYSDASGQNSSDVTFKGLFTLLEL